MMSRRDEAQSKGGFACDAIALQRLRLHPTPLPRLPQPYTRVLEMLFKTASIILFPLLAALESTLAAPANGLPTKDGTYTDSIAKMNSAIECPNGIKGLRKCNHTAYDLQAC
jgi:hypothetical protein